MIHEIFPHRFSNQYLPGRKIEDNDYVIHYNENSVFLKSRGDEFELPRKKDFAEITDATEAVFLFSLDEIPCFLIWDTLKADKPGLTYKDITFFRTAAQKEVAWITIAGFHLMNWYGRNRFCGTCGSRTRHKTDERALSCPECGATVYPRISPAIIVAITCNNKILLARSPHFPAGFHSLIAGYVDIGESLEETVIREVKEEVGLDVRNIRYYKNQPWPLSGSMMVGFFAEADETQPISINTKEISEAAWFTRGNLPQYPLKISIAGEMIEKFDRGPASKDS